MDMSSKITGKYVSEYLREEIGRLTDPVYLVSEEMARINLNPPFPWNGWYEKEPSTCTASQASTADITVETLRDVCEAVCRKIKCIYYTTTKLCPAKRGDGSPLFWYIQDTDEYFFHPDNEEEFVGRFRDEGWYAQDLKKLDHISRLERLLLLKESYGQKYFKSHKS